MSAYASGAEPSSSSARNREHQQGKQDREFTPAQKAAVDRVRKCKVTAYYEILNIKKEAEENEIKKAYRKLALVMHPDKNGAPGADEAFKLVSKAFQVLSDPQKRSIYDSTGGDPESRSFGGGGPPGGGNPFPGFQGRGTPGRGPFADEISPEELFNMFFGGGMGGGGGTFFDLGGGPGIRIHHFGGPTPRRRPNPNANQADAEQDNSMSSIIIRLLPLILIFAFSILSSFLGGDGTGSSAGYRYEGPQIKFKAVPPYTERKLTPVHKIPFYVNPADLSKYIPKTKDEMEKHAERVYIKGLNAECDRETMRRQQKVEESRGIFFTDQEKLKEAREMPMPSCQRLYDMRERRRQL